MRFLFNFVIYGLIFFAIYKSFPDAFATMVVWADKVYEVLREIVLELSARIYELWNHAGKKEVVHPGTLQSLLFPCVLSLKSYFKQ